MKERSLTGDLNLILADTSGLWDELRGEKIFITGGTGFLGAWLLESFVRANQHHRLKASATVLTRNPDLFKRKAPHLFRQPSLRFHTGDVRKFRFPKGDFSRVIHAASSADPKDHKKDPLLTLETIVFGTKRVLEFSRHCHAKKVLFISSGAVYGKQPLKPARLSENSPMAPDPVDPYSAYGEGKRSAELLCALYAEKFKMPVKIARCFTFVGPYQSLDGSFAVSNFIKDGLCQRPIRVKDGTAFRSYLYAADLAVWLWTILSKGRSGYPYNVGSEKALTIARLARLVSKTMGSREKISAKKSGTPKPPSRYVPSTRRARQELGLRQTIGLESAIKKTVDWYSAHGK